MTSFYSKWLAKASLALVASLLAGVACAPSFVPASAPERRSLASPLPSPALIPAPLTSGSPAPAPRQPPVAPTIGLPDPDRTVWPGAIIRFQQKAVIPEADLAGPVVGFHLDPKRVAFRVHYTPGRAQYISEWAADLGRGSDTPLLVFPAGFFTGDNVAYGLLVADSVRYSQPYEFGGVFAVQGGQPDIRWLDPQPIKPGEKFEQAVQAFPVYLSRGVIPPLTEHETRAPRTVIAETRGGEFVVLFSLTPLFRTTELAQWLIDSDLDIYNALNLDGGRSAGYWAGDGDQANSFVPVPAVIAVYAK